MTRWQKCLFILTPLGLLNLACKSPDFKSAMEEYLPYTEKPSLVHLPIETDLDSLQLLLDQQVDSALLAEGGSFSDSDLDVKVRKTGAIQLEADAQELRYQLPLQLGIEYDAGLGKLTADGEIDIQFKTAFSVDSSWNLVTNTELVDYQWIKQPKLRLGFISLPGSLLADWVIRFGKKEVASIIDEQIRQNVPLRDWISEAWVTIREPIPLEGDVDAWLLVNPQSLELSPFQTEDRKLKLVLRARSRPFVTLGTRPDSLLRDAALPPLGSFQPEGEARGFDIYVRAAIPYEKAEALARENFAGETFSAGKRTATIEDIRLFGQRDKLVVSLDLTGTYTGKVELSGRPEYRERTNRIVLKDLDYTLKTKNFLHRTAGWLLKSTLRSRLQKELDFLLDTNLGEWEQMIEDQLDGLEIEEGVSLETGVDRLQVEGTFLTREAMVVDVGLRGSLKIRVSNFQ